MQNYTTAHQKASRLAHRAIQQEHEGAFREADRLDRALMHLAWNDEEDDIWDEEEDDDWNQNPGDLTFLGDMAPYIETWCQESGLLDPSFLLGDLPRDTAEFLGDRWEALIQILQSQYKGPPSGTASQKLSAFNRFVKGVRQAPPAVCDALVRDMGQGLNIEDATRMIPSLADHFNKRPEQIPLLATHSTPVLNQALRLTKRERNNNSTSVKAASKQVRANIGRVETICNDFHVNPLTNTDASSIIDFATLYPRLAEVAKSDPQLCRRLKGANIFARLGKVNEDVVLAYLQRFPDMDVVNLKNVIWSVPDQAHAGTVHIDRSEGFHNWLNDPARKFNFEEHQNLPGGIKRIYGDQLDEETLKLLLENPCLVGTKLKDIQAVTARYANFMPPDMELPREHLFHLIGVFGSQTPQWARRFDPNHILDNRPPNEDSEDAWTRCYRSRDIIHDAAQCLPKFNSRRQVQGLGQFLLSQPSVTTTVRILAQNWPNLTPEERIRIIKSPQDAVPAIMGRMLKVPPGKTHLLPFYMESTQWGAAPTMEARHRLDGQKRSTTTTLADLYENSLSVPLPAWANVSVQKYGYTGHFLPREDARGLFLGQYTNCCQHPNGEAASSAYYGQSSPTSAFFVVEDPRGEIVAQSWAWQSKDGGVVFDNIEAKGLGSREAKVREIYTTAAQQMMAKGAKYVNVGGGYSDMDLTGLERAQRARGLSSEVYTDAEEQFRFPNPSPEEEVSVPPTTQVARTMRAITVRLAARAKELEDAGEARRADLIDQTLLRFASDWDYGEDEDWDDDDEGEKGSGEFWLEDGSANYADGDLGDVNHEMLAEQAILGRLGYDLNPDWMNEYPTTRDSAGEQYLELAQGRGEHNSPYWEDYVRHANEEDPEGDWKEYSDWTNYIRWLHTHGLPEKQRMKPEEVEKHLSGMGDPRAHAIEHFGWARLQDHNAETWDLSDASLQNLSNGLYDAYGDSVRHMRFNVELNKNHESLWDVPYSEIESGKIRERLRHFSPPPSVAPRIENPYINSPIGRRLYRYPGGSAHPRRFRVAQTENCALEKSGLLRRKQCGIDGP